MLASSPGAAQASSQARASHRLCTLGEAARRRARRRLAARIGRIAPPGAVLDVASGDPLLLEALRATGRLVTPLGWPGGDGTPPDLRAVDVTELGGRYAAIVFWQSLGRLRAPGAALEHAAALLKPGGMLAIAQPRPARPQARELGERLHALGLEVGPIDLLDRRSPAGWVQGMLGGVVSIEARR